MITYREPRACLIKRKSSLAKGARHTITLSTKLETDCQHHEREERVTRLKARRGGACLRSTQAIEPPTTFQTGWLNVLRHDHTKARQTARQVHLLPARRHGNTNSDQVVMTGYFKEDSPVSSVNACHTCHGRQTYFPNFLENWEVQRSSRGGKRFSLGLVIGWKQKAGATSGFTSNTPVTSYRGKSMSVLNCWGEAEMAPFSQEHSRPLQEGEAPPSKAGEFAQLFSGRWCCKLTTQALIVAYT